MSRKQGPHLKDGDATDRDCRRTPTTPALEPSQWLGGGAA